MAASILLGSEWPGWLDNIQGTTRDLLVAKQSKRTALKSTRTEKEMLNGVVNKSYYWSHNNHKMSG